MKKSPLRLLFTALVSTTLLTSGMALPAGAQQLPSGSGYSAHGGSQYTGSRDWRRHYRSSGSRWSGRQYRSGRSYYRSHRRHSDRDFAIGLGLGILGAIIVAPQLRAPRYAVPRSRVSGSFCHVHGYKVRGMTYHRDVRCFQHQNWNHPSIQYVR